MRIKVSQFRYNGSRAQSEQPRVPLQRLAVRYRNNPGFRCIRSLHANGHQRRYPLKTAPFNGHRTSPDVIRIFPGTASLLVITSVLSALHW
jgi:hypothetical protein